MQIETSLLLPSSCYLDAFVRCVSLSPIWNSVYPHRAMSLPAGFSIETMPDDAFASVLLFLEARDIEGGISAASRTLKRAGDASSAWLDQCRRTGKIHDEEEAGERRRQEAPEDFRSRYRESIFVPGDVSDVGAAVKIAQSRGMRLIVLRPGLHVGPLRFCADGKSELDLTIRSLRPPSQRKPPLPEDLTILLVEDFAQTPSPLISVKSCSTSTRLQLQGIYLRHNSPGTDIWSTNTNILVEGSRTSIKITNCVVESVTGRGIVVSNGASAELDGTTVVNCAGTGLYVGDEGSTAFLSFCNVVSNGFGGRRISLLAAPGMIPKPLHELLEDHVTCPMELLPEGEDDDGTWLSRRVVPPGHSGIYVEHSEIHVEHSFVGRNCLDGITVVRDGVLRLDACDIMTNTNGSPVALSDQFLGQRGGAEEQDGRGRVEMDEYGSSGLHHGWGEIGVLTWRTYFRSKYHSFTRVSK